MRFSISTNQQNIVLSRLKDFEKDVLLKSNGLVSASAKRSGKSVVLTLITPLDNIMFERIFQNEIQVAIKKLDKEAKVKIMKD